MALFPIFTIYIEIFSKTQVYNFENLYENKIELELKIDI